MSASRQARGKRFRLLGGAVVTDHHAHALARERAADDRAHAPRATGDDGHAPFISGIRVRTFFARRFHRLAWPFYEIYENQDETYSECSVGSIWIGGAGFSLRGLVLAQD